jgi:hypothetical protein
LSKKHTSLPLASGDGTGNLWSPPPRDNRSGSLLRATNSGTVVGELTGIINGSPLSDLKEQNHPRQH